MFSIPLPPRPQLDQYKKRAKELLAAVNSGELEALRSFAEDWFRALARLFAPAEPIHDWAERQLIEESAAELRRLVAAELTRSGGKFVLANAQLLVANLHGFANWKEFTTEIHERTRSDASPYERAADAIVAGSLDALLALLARDPGRSAVTQGPRTTTRSVSPG